MIHIFLFRGITCPCNTSTLAIIYRFLWPYSALELQLLLLALLLIIDLEIQHLLLSRGTTAGVAFVELVNLLLLLALHLLLRLAICEKQLWIGDDGCLQSVK